MPKSPEQREPLESTFKKNKNWGEEKDLSNLLARTDERIKNREFAEEEQLNQLVFGYSLSEVINRKLGNFTKELSAYRTSKTVGDLESFISHAFRRSLRTIRDGEELSEREQGLIRQAFAAVGLFETFVISEKGGPELIKEKYLEKYLSEWEHSLDKRSMSSRVLFDRYHQNAYFLVNIDNKKDSLVDDIAEQIGKSDQPVPTIPGFKEHQAEILEDVSLDQFNIICPFVSYDEPTDGSKKLMKIYERLFTDALYNALKDTQGKLCVYQKMDGEVEGTAETIIEYESSRKVSQELLKADDLIVTVVGGYLKTREAEQEGKKIQQIKVGIKKEFIATA